jgi:phosphatidylserine/phosphatidylglycerophosphate/cardiolipin synthase-like enzyme
MRASGSWLGVLLFCAAFTAGGQQFHGELPASGTVQYAFAPEGDATGLIVSALAGAREEIYVQAYLFTYRDIGRALTDAVARGVSVSLIADKAQFDAIPGNLIPWLASRGVTVFLDADHAAAHDKVILLDPLGESPAVITGSFNLTWSAQHRNAENVVALKGHPDLARAYLDNWLRHRAHASRYNP